jgi:hypothetical protein
VGCIWSGCYRGNVSVTVRVDTTSATALVLVRWKPSARSRSLRDISSLTAFARIGVAQTTEVNASPPRPSSPPGRCLWGRLPNIPRRNSLCDQILPGGLKGRGPVAVSGANGVACAGPILVSVVRCGCPSENIPRSDRQRPEGFQRTTSTAVWSADRLSSTVPRTKTDGNATP